MAIQVLVLLTIFTKIQGAKILSVAPQCSLSHQIIYRPVHEELVRRGHEVTFITTNPAYPDGNAPKNLIEIDVGPESYAFWANEFNFSVSAKREFRTTDANRITEVAPKLFAMQLSQKKVREAIEKKGYDLLILQGWVRPTMLLSHLHKVPVVKMSSLTMIYDNAQTVGAPDHPLYQPNYYQQRVYNLTWWEQIVEVYDTLNIQRKFYNNEVHENAILRQFYKDMPDLNELNNNVDLLCLNVQSPFEKNRPKPPNTIYFGFVHKKPPKPLPEDIQQYMDSSKNGVIYMSFGSVIPVSKLPQHLRNIFIKVFSQLPYNILWKNDEDLLNRPKNVKISKWFPQSDIFRHPNLKLIITQGGIQTAEEAIDAGVPLVCIPFFVDQWLNGENFMHYGIGKMVEKETITEEAFREAILSIIEDKGYRERIARLRSLIHDHPRPPLERVVWWLEHVLKHGGGRHLRGPAANLPAYQYYEVELLAVVISSALPVVFLFLCIIYYVIKKVIGMFSNRFKVKI